MLSSSLPPNTPPLYRKQSSSEGTRKRPPSPPAASSSAGSSLSPSSSPPSRVRSMSESSANSSAFVVHSTRPRAYSSSNNITSVSAGNANNTAQRGTSDQFIASRGGATSPNKKEKEEAFGDRGERRMFRSGSADDPSGRVGKRAPEESESENESSDSSSASPTTSNVVDFLYQAGKRYKQRLQLLRQEKIAVEMANLTGKPTISPFAEEYYSNRMKLRQRLGHGGEEETVQDRLHRLHERKLEREREKLAKYAAQKQEKELADLTLKPKITEAAKRLERRGSQADITAKWLEERKQKTMKLHEAKLYREMAEVQPIPMISPYSTQIVSSGANSFFQSNDASIFRHSRSSSAGGGLETDQSRREAAGGVSEYLLAREKERRQRLQAMREAREKLEASAFKPVISAKASALQMGDVVDRLYQPKRNALERYSTHLHNTSATRSTKTRKGNDHHQSNDNDDENNNNGPLDYSSASSASSAVHSDDNHSGDHHTGGSGEEEEEESDYEEAVDPEGNLIIVRIVRKVKKKRNTSNKRSSRRRRRGARGSGAVSPIQEAKAALDKIFNPECTFKPYISEASRILVEQRERRLKEEAEADRAKQEDHQNQSHHDHLFNSSASPSPPSPSAHSQQRKRQQQHNNNSSNMSALVRTNNSDPSRDPQYRKVYPDHTFKPTISETSRMLAAMRQKKADERERIDDAATLKNRGERDGRVVGNANTVIDSSKEDDSVFDTNEVSSVRSSQGTNRSYKKATRSKLAATENANSKNRTNGYGSDDEGENKTEEEEEESPQQRSSDDRRERRREGRRERKDLSTELSVNRHLKLLPNDDDDDDDDDEEYDDNTYQYANEDYQEVKKLTTTATTHKAGGGGGRHQTQTTSHGRPPQPHSSRSSSQVIGTTRNTKTHNSAAAAATARAPPAASYPHRRSASAALSSTNSNTNTNTNSAFSSSSIEFYGKPSINANSKRIAEEKKRRLKEELKREQARLAAVLGGQKAMTEDGTTSLSSSSVAVGGGHYYGASRRRGGQEGGYGAEEYVVAGGGVDAVTAAAGYASEDVESLTAHDLLYHLSKKKREEKERRIAAELRERALSEEAKCTFTPQREFGKGNFKGDPAMSTRRLGADEETSLTLERRRLIMTKEGAEAFARRNEQWLRRRDQTLASLKSSEVDKGLEECTFHPRVHDQIPLPIGASANAPGVDNFLQRQQAARQRKEEEERRKSSLGGSVPNVDRRPIGGVTRPEPFLLGKDREKQQRLLTYGSHQHNSTSLAEGDFYSGTALNRSELHRQTKANINTVTPPPSAHPRHRFVDPNRTSNEMEPTDTYYNNDGHREGGGFVGGHGKGMTKREWAGIREEMLTSAPERSTHNTYTYGGVSGRNGQHINSRYQGGVVSLPPPPPSHFPPSASVGGPNRNRGGTDPHMAEFSQHPSALAKAVDTFAGASALMGAYRGEGAHTTASTARRGSAAPPHTTAESLHDQYLGSEKRPSGQEGRGGGIGGLFEASPADFVLNNHNRIAREFHMR